MNNKSEYSTPTSTSRQESGLFIDDYSHLRLSYYQQRTLDFISNTNDDSSFSTNPDVSLNRSDCITMETEINDTTSTDIKTVEEKDEHQKPREHLVSQMPDLPHPSFTMASILGAASQRMSRADGVYLRYNNKIEEGLSRVRSRDEINFSPHHRSTMLPNQFPDN